MNKFTLAVAATVLSFGTLSGVAIADDVTINERSEMVVIAALVAQGVSVDGVEEWGDYVRVWSNGANGGYSMSLFDATTLQPVTR